MTPSVAELDARLGTPEFDADPHETLRRLREEDPVHWNDTIGAWIITRYDDVLTTFRDVAHFSNEGRLAKTTEYLGEAVRSGLRPFEEHYTDKGSCTPTRLTTPDCGRSSSPRSTPRLWRR